jgi:hypothetical protein
MDGIWIGVRSGKRLKLEMSPQHALDIMIDQTRAGFPVPDLERGVWVFYRSSPGLWERGFYNGPWFKVELARPNLIRVSSDRGVE